MEKKRKQAIIELNGQRYDANTGKSLSTGHSVKATMSDVMPRRPSSQRSATHSKQVHKKTEHSHTLMRSAVKKPTSSAHVAPVNNEPAKQTVTHNSQDVTRTKRAEHIQQSSLISRFGDIMNTPVHMPSLTSTSAELKKRHVQQMDVVAAPSHHAPALLHHPKKSSAELLTEKGMRSASSHESSKAKKPRLRHKLGKRLGLKPKAVSIAASSLALVLLGGFVAYQNVPNLAVRYASMKAGVKATLPGYQPSGFAIDSRVEYSPGEVAVAYKANADDRAYTVTQKSTAWNNDSLKDYVASTSGKEPQSFPEKGKTIYLYGDSNAAWVDKGVLYKISGQSSLNADQLIKIATSL